MDGFERVHVELDWYDGPRAGVADVEGVPHYFRAHGEYWDPHQPDDEYDVWPVPPELVELERQAWSLYVAASGRSGPATYPGGHDPRYDELERRLEPLRAMPAQVRRLVAEFRRADPPADACTADGPGYLVRWCEPKILEDREES